MKGIIMFKENFYTNKNTKIKEVVHIKENEVWDDDDVIVFDAEDSSKDNLPEFDVKIRKRPHIDNQDMPEFLSNFMKFWNHVSIECISMIDVEEDKQWLIFECLSETAETYIGSMLRIVECEDWKMLWLIWYRLADLVKACLDKLHIEDSFLRPFIGHDVVFSLIKDIWKDNEWLLEYFFGKCPL